MRVGPGVDHDPSLRVLWAGMQEPRVVYWNPQKYGRAQAGEERQKLASAFPPGPIPQAGSVGSCPSRERAL